MENAYAVSRFLLSGSGGQGVITMAILLAEAAVKYEGLVAVQSQSYGPEARGVNTLVYYFFTDNVNVLAGLNAGILCSGIMIVVFFEMLRAVF